jgi:hypothetical protein
LDKYGFFKKIIAYVKDEESNLDAMTIVLKVVVNCESFGLKESFRALALGIFFQKHVNITL